MLGRADNWKRLNCLRNTTINTIDFSEFVVRTDCEPYDEDDIANWIQSGKNLYSTKGYVPHSNQPVGTETTGNRVKWNGADECAKTAKANGATFFQKIGTHCVTHTERNINNVGRCGGLCWKLEETKKFRLFRYPSCQQGLKANSAVHYTHNDRTDPSRLRNRVEENKMREPMLMTPFICTHDKTNGTTREAHWERNPCGHAKDAMVPVESLAQSWDVAAGDSATATTYKKIGIKTRLNNGFL